MHNLRERLALWIAPWLEPGIPLIYADLVAADADLLYGRTIPLDEVDT